MKHVRAGISTADNETMENELSAAAKAPSHFLAWVPRMRPDSAIRQASGRSVAERARRPISHVTGQKHLAGRVKAGDVIWLAGNDSRFGLRAPSLDGRIAVASCEPRGKGHAFLAGDDSYWLPWADAEDVFAGLELISAAGPTTTLKPPVWVHLQTTRQVAPAGAARLERHAAELLARPRLFISYRWLVEPKIVGGIVAAVASSGFGPWWDRWSAPRGLSTGIDKKEEGRGTSKPDLEELMAEGIEGSAAALIVTDDHGNTSATAFERERIEARRLPLIEVGTEQLRQPSGLEALRRSLCGLYRDVTGRPAERQH